MNLTRNKRSTIVLAFVAAACESMEPKPVTRELVPRQLAGSWLLPRVRDIVSSEAPPSRLLVLAEDGGCTIGQEMWKAVTGCAGAIGAPVTVPAAPRGCRWQLRRSSGHAVVQITIPGNHLGVWELAIHEGSYLLDELGLQALLCKGDAMEETYLTKVSSRQPEADRGWA